MAASFTKDYMFMGCIHYINQVNTTLYYVDIINVLTLEVIF